LAEGLQRTTPTQFVELLAARGVCTDCNEDAGMRKASTRLLRTSSPLAATVWLELKVTLQTPVPVQLPPLQPSNFSPMLSLGIVVSVILVPVGKPLTHIPSVLPLVVEQFIPVGADGIKIVGSVSQRSRERDRTLAKEGI
jgi:hypothetical protein